MAQRLNLTPIASQLPVKLAGDNTGLMAIFPVAVAPGGFNANRRQDSIDPSGSRHDFHHDHAVRFHRGGKVLLELSKFFRRP